MQVVHPLASELRIDVDHPTAGRFDDGLCPIERGVELGEDVQCSEEFVSAVTCDTNLDTCLLQQPKRLFGSILVQDGQVRDRQVDSIFIPP